MSFRKKPSPPNFFASLIELLNKEIVNVSFSKNHFPNEILIIYLPLMLIYVQ